MILTSGGKEFSENLGQSCKAMTYHYHFLPTQKAPEKCSTAFQGKLRCALAVVLYHFQRNLSQGVA